jgi:hypothetical protein
LLQTSHCTPEPVHKLPSADVAMQQLESESASKPPAPLPALVQEYLRRKHGSKSKPKSKPKPKLKSKKSSAPSSKRQTRAKPALPPG